MILIYFNYHDNSYYYYLSRFDSSKIVGEDNNFGDILIGLYLVDYIDNKLVSYKSSFSAELLYKNKCSLLIEPNRKKG